MAALATELEELEVRTSVSMLPWPASPLASSGILTMTGPVRRRPGLRLHRPRAAEAAAAGGDSSGDMDVEGAEVEGAAQPAKRLTWAQLEAAVLCSSGAELQVVHPRGAVRAGRVRLAPRPARREGVAARRAAAGRGGRGHT